MASVRLVVVVKYNFCHRDFFIDQKFWMGLRFGEFQGQSNTFTFSFMKIVFTLLNDRHEAKTLLEFWENATILHQEKTPFSYLEWISLRYINVFV